MSSSTNNDSIVVIANKGVATIKFNWCNKAIHTLVHLVFKHKAYIATKKWNKMELIR